MKKRRGKQNARRDVGVTKPHLNENLCFGRLASIRFSLYADSLWRNDRNRLCLLFWMDGAIAQRRKETRLLWRANLPTTP